MSDHAMPDVVCVTCQQPLNRFQQDGVTTWLHPKAKEADHEAIPIPRAEATHVVYVCDFCGGGDVHWSYPVGGEIKTITAMPKFSEEKERKQVAKDWDVERHKAAPAQELGENRFSDRWAACDPCSDLIELRDMERLITRLRRLEPAKFAVPPVTRTLLRQHFGEFFRLVRDREPIEPA
jgi:hypothetical protein